MPVMDKDVALSILLENVELGEKEYDQVLSYLIERARKDFYVFVKLIAPLVLPETFEDGRHIELICKELQKIERGVVRGWKYMEHEGGDERLGTERQRRPRLDPEKELKRLQIFVPPGSMKTRLASNLFPAWVLGKHPNWSFLAIGADFEFAVDTFGRPTKEIVELPQYQAIFPGTVLKKDVQGAGRWDTSKKGRFVARGAGQGLAGRRAHIAICDDIMNEQTTDTDRAKINKWYQRGLRTRLLPNGAEIIINTRWHLDDLSGNIMKVDKNSKVPWRVVSIPALLDQKTSKLLRKRTDPPDYLVPGTSFWPELWPTERLLEIKQTMPVSDWEALYMQNPVPEEGTIIKRNGIRRWSDSSPPKCLMVVCSMDTAYSQKERSDFTACTTWGVFLKDTSLKENRDIANSKTSWLNTDSRNASGEGDDDDDGEDIPYDLPGYFGDGLKDTPDKIACVILLGAQRGRWSFPELCEKAKEINNEFKPEFFIIEQKGSGISLLQALNETEIPLAAFKPEVDKEKRLHFVSPFFNQGRVFFPDNKDWANEVEEELLQFPYGKHDDYVDTTSQAIQWLRDSGYLRTNSAQDYRGEYGRGDRDSDGDGDYETSHSKTYWSALTG